MTLVEVLLALLIFTTTTLICSKYYNSISRLASINTTGRQMGIIAKNKMEEVKSGYIYIDDYKNNILDIDYAAIDFIEKDYNINILMIPLENNENINYIDLKVTDKSGNRSYNLIRYVNFYENNFPNIYEEFTNNNH